MKKALLYILLLLPLLAQAQTHVRKTNLPHIYIDTYNGVGITSKTTYVQGTLTRVDTLDQVEVIDSLNIRGRGNSTWNMAKKPYRLKFNKKEKFLGKGYANAKSWTLIANHADKTMMRNALTQLMGTFVGLKNCPAHEFCDLTLNNSYRGTYMISDHVEVRPHRVKVTEQDYPLADTSDITGGYLFEFDGFNDGRGFRTSRSNSYIRVHYPDEDEIATEQMNYARQFFSDIEKRLYGSDFKDPERGYRAMMDTTSLINWYLATEICANIDGFFSTYCYKEQGDDRLFWGPLWDYDIAYGNDSRKGDTSRKLMRTDAYSGSQAWVQRMWQDEWFQRACGRRYHELREAGLDSCMLAWVDSMALHINASQQLNFELWGINRRAYNERVLYSSYGEYVRDLRSFITTHNAYLAEQFPVLDEEDPEEPDDPNKPGTEPDDPIEVTLPEGCYLTITNAGTGTAVDVENGMVCGWAVDATRHTQLWNVEATAGGYYQLYNAESGLALVDPNTGGIGAQLSVGSDEGDEALWRLVPQGVYYNLINVASGNCANLSGGSGSNGTAILSYTSDNRNAVSNNRRWMFNATEHELPNIDPDEPGDEPDEPGNEPGDEPDEPGDEPDEPGDEPDEPVVEPDIIAAAPTDYALAYNPVTRELHFGGNGPLNFKAKVFGQNGQLIGMFDASQRFDMQNKANGLYIVTWHFEGRSHSIKFVVD